MALLIIVSYILSILLTRYLDFKANYKNYGFTYKAHLNRAFWFMPILNIIYALYMFIKIFVGISIQWSDNKYISWFFLNRNYVSKDERKNKFSL
jgi:hypothetical protein